MNRDELIYLDSYVLQQDMWIRLPKSILENMNIEKGRSVFIIYYNRNQNCLVLVCEDSEEVRDNKWE